MPFEARGFATSQGSSRQIGGKCRVGWGRIKDLRGNKPAGILAGCEPPDTYLLRFTSDKEIIMNKKDTSYRIPEGFDPQSTINAVRGLTDAIHQFLLEGPGTARVIPAGERAGLNALVEQLQAEVHALHDYLREIENRTTLELPMSDADFDAIDVRFARKDEIKEEPALYVVNRH